MAVSAYLALPIKFTIHLQKNVKDVKLIKLLMNKLNPAYVLKQLHFGTM